MVKYIFFALGKKSKQAFFLFGLKTINTEVWGPRLSDLEEDRGQRRHTIAICFSQGDSWEDMPNWVMGSDVFPYLS